MPACADRVAESLKSVGWGRNSATPGDGIPPA